MRDARCLPGATLRYDALEVRRGNHSVVAPVALHRTPACRCSGIRLRINAFVAWHDYASIEWRRGRSCSTVRRAVDAYGQIRVHPGTCPTPQGQAGGCRANRHGQPHLPFCGCGRGLRGEVESICHCSNPFDRHPSVHDDREHLLGLYVKKPMPWPTPAPKRRKWGCLQNDTRPAQVGHSQ